MKVQINGEQETLEEENDISILDFLEMKGQDPQKVVIEYNGEIVKQKKWSEINLNEKDQLEILKFVGGG